MEGGALVVQGLAQLADALLACGSHQIESERGYGARANPDRTPPARPERTLMWAMMVLDQVELNARTSAQSAEVLRGLGHHIGEQLELDATNGRAVSGDVEVDNGVRHFWQIDNDVLASRRAGR